MPIFWFAPTDVRLTDVGMSHSLLRESGCPKHRPPSDYDPAKRMRWRAGQESFGEGSSGWSRESHVGGFPTCVFRSV